MTTSEQQPEVTVSLVRVPSQTRWRLGPVWRWRMTYKGEEVEGKDEYGSIVEAAENATGIYGSLQRKERQERRERQAAERAPAPPKPERQPKFPTLEPGTLVKVQAEPFWWLPVRRDDGPPHDPARRIYLNSRHGTVWARRDRIRYFRDPTRSVNSIACGNRKCRRRANGRPLMPSETGNRRCRAQPGRKKSRDMSDQKPIDEIIGEGAGAGSGVAPQHESPPATSDPAGDAPAGRDQGDGSWTYNALRSERSKRQRTQEELAEVKQRLASYEEAPPQTQGEQFWSRPDETISRLERAATNSTLRASRAEHIAEHGRASYTELEAAIGEQMRAGNPDMYVLSEAMRQSDDPVAVAVAWYEHAHGRSPQPRRSTVYPSNLANARSVGARRGPAWSGPTALDDIFNRGRK